MIKVRIVVNDYLQCQGINSVVDQFVLHKDEFSKYGVEIVGVQDINKIWYDIPQRDNNYGKNSFISKGKRTKFAKTFLFDCVAIIKNRIHYGKKWFYDSSLPEAREILIIQNLQMAHKILKTCKTRNYKVIYMTHMFSDYLSQTLINRPHIKDTFVERLLRKDYKFVFEKSDAIVTICNVAKKSIEDEFECKKIVVIPNSVSVPMIETKPGEHSTINIAMASSVTIRKGFDILCEAISLIEEEIQSKIEIHVFGDGDYLEETKKNINSKSKMKIHFYGNVQQPCNNYGNMDALLLTSRDETMPMSILEAMQVGLPIIATDVGAIREMVIDGINGILLQPSATSVAEGLTRLVEQKSELSSWGKASKDIYQRHFSMDVWVSNFQSLFENIIWN